MDALKSNSELSNEQASDWSAAGDDRAGKTSLAPELNDSVALLQARQQELQQQLAGLADGDGEAAHPRFSNHLAEDAQDQQQFQGEVARRYILLNELRQVEHALTRVSEGQYGICEDCGREIPPRRLHIIPAATLCVTCQANRESRRGMH